MTITAIPVDDEAGVYAQIPVDQINPNPMNIRFGGPGDIGELAASIQEIGVLEPLVVVPVVPEPGRAICPICRADLPAEGEAVPVHASRPSEGSRPETIGSVPSGRW